MATHFKDLYKPVKNVLSSGYYTDGVEFNMRTTTPNGVRLNSTGTRFASSGQLTGNLEWNQNVVKNGNTFGVTGKLENDGTVKASVDVIGLTKGLLLQADGAMHTVDGKENGDNAKLSAKYTHEKVATSTEVTFARAKQPVVANVSAVATHEGLSVGGSASLDLKSEDKLSDYDLGVRYSRDRLDIAMLLNKKLSNVTVGVATQARPDLALAVQFDQKLKYAAEEKKSPAVWTMGFNKVIDADSSVKGKIDTRGIAAAVYSIRLNKDLKADLTVQTNVKNASKGSDIGVKFDYAPF